MYKNFKFLHGIWCAALVTLSSLCFSEPTVIRDYGDTRPTGIPAAEDIIRLANEMNVQPEDITDFSPYSFPIESEFMEPGVLGKAFLHQKKGIIPFFVVGADRDSRQWLIDNKDFLVENDIYRGLVTNIPDAAHFKLITEAAKPLQLYAMNADDIAHTFQVFVYPIVITQEEIAQ